MITEYIFKGMLFFAAFTTLLSTGLLLAFALIVMPGIGGLDDRAFLRAFQSVDAVIQRGQPLFIVLWLGSMVSLFIAATMGLIHRDGWIPGFLIAAAGLYFFGVQVTTIKGNIPLNNRLQAIDLGAMSDAGLSELRKSFEGPWNRLNVFRTVMAILVSLLLLVTMRMAGG
jgi:uncharacterized membrane protein